MRWRPILDAALDAGIALTFELHPGSDVFDGATFEAFLDSTDNHPAACINYDPSHFLLQQLDYLDFIRIYGDRIRAFHVKDAEFQPSGRMGVYGGYQGWTQRAGRFRSLGDGQVDYIELGNEDSCHALHDGGAVHVDGGAQRQDEAGDPVADPGAVFDAVHGQRQRG